MPHKFNMIYDRDVRGQTKAEVDSDGNLRMRLRAPRGMYRFYFEVDRGTFDADLMFFNVYGVKVGPSTGFYRVPGMTHVTDKTRYIGLEYPAFVAPVVDFYVDRNFIGSALTEFQSHREFKAGRVLDFYGSPQIAYTEAEAAQCYEVETGVKRFRRHMVFCKPDVIVVLDEVELERARGAEMHFVFCIRKPTTVQKKVPDNQLKIMNAATAQFWGQKAGLGLVVPRGLKQRLEINECPVARGYTDQDSLFRRVTINSRKTKSHRFLTLLLPAASQTRQEMPAVKETIVDGAVSLQVQKGDTETIIIFPDHEQQMRNHDMDFAGKLLVLRKKAGKVEDIASLEAKRLCLAGKTIFDSSKSRNVFKVFSK